MTGPASAADDIGSTAAYQAALAAHTPIPLASAVTTEAKTFQAAAQADNMSDSQMSSLLKSGDWVSYPVESVIVEGGDAEGGTELSASTASLSKPTWRDLVDSALATPENEAEKEPLVAAQRYCYTGNGPTITVKAKNVTGATLWYYQVGEKYCYNKSTKGIYSFDREPYVNHKIYNWAQALGWSWEGQDLTGTKGPSRYKWGGNASGGLQTWRKGTFKYDPTHVEIGSFQKFPWVHLYEHGDGSYKYSYGS
jgi:hypothetical protein